MKNLWIKAVSGFVFVIGAVAALVFLPAWTLHYWQAWTFLAVFTVSITAIFIYLAKNDPELLARRVKTREKDGYTAIQIGLDEQKPKRVSKPRLGHFTKNNLKPFRLLREIRTEGSDTFTVGQTLGAEVLEGTQWVDVSGVSKGKGFQGVIRRHHFAGGAATHEAEAALQDFGLEPGRSTQGLSGGEGRRAGARPAPNRRWRRRGGRAGAWRPR